jgi:hypothetical protein
MNYRLYAFKSGGQWMVKLKGKVLAQFFDSIDDVVKYARSIQSDLIILGVKKQ